MWTRRPAYDGVREDAPAGRQSRACAHRFRDFCANALALQALREGSALGFLLRFAAVAGPALDGFSSGIELRLLFRLIGVAVLAHFRGRSHGEVQGIPQALQFA